MVCCMLIVTERSKFATADECMDYYASTRMIRGEVTNATHISLWTVMIRDANLLRIFALRSIRLIRDSLSSTFFISVRPYIVFTQVLTFLFSLHNLHHTQLQSIRVHIEVWFVCIVLQGLTVPSQRRWVSYFYRGPVRDCAVSLQRVSFQDGIFRDKFERCSYFFLCAWATYLL